MTNQETKRAIHAEPSKTKGSLVFFCEVEKYSVASEYTGINGTGAFPTGVWLRHDRQYEGHEAFGFHCFLCVFKDCVNELGISSSHRQSREIRNNFELGSGGSGGPSLLYFMSKISAQTLYNYFTPVRTSKFQDSFWGNSKTHHLHGFRTWRTCP